MTLDTFGKRRLKSTTNNAKSVFFDVFAIVHTLFHGTNFLTLHQSLTKIDF